MFIKTKHISVKWKLLLRISSIEMRISLAYLSHETFSYVCMRFFSPRWVTTGCSSTECKKQFGSERNKGLGKNLLHGGFDVYRHGHL